MLWLGELEGGGRGGILRRGEKPGGNLGDRCGGVELEMIDFEEWLVFVDRLESG